MALTDHSDVFGSVQEDGFNRIFQHLLLQRPSLFSYGTQWFQSNPQHLCHRIKFHPEVQRRGNPLVSVEDPLPVPGTGGRFGLDFCAQLVDVKLDLHPNNGFNLPGELDPLLRQQGALTARFCVGLRCPDAGLSHQLGDQVAFELEQGKIDPRQDDAPRLPPTPIPGERVICFCLDVFATFGIDRIITAQGEVLVPRLRGFEIVDIRPEGLENAMECYVEATLRVGILPRLRFAVDVFIDGLGDFLGLAPALTPLSPDVPNNPAIEEDQLKVFVSLGF